MADKPIRDLKGRILKGAKFSEEHKEKIRLSKLGSNNPNYGKKLSEERRQQIHLMLLGNKHTLGHKLSQEHKRKIGLGHQGRKLSDNAKRRIGLAHSNEAHWNWKGEEVQYRALHHWVRKNFPVPKHCVFCSEEKRLYLANMTGIYNREIINWKYLCAKCHIKHDDIVVRAMETKRKKGLIR